MMKKSLVLTVIMGSLLISLLVYKKMNTVKFTIVHTNDHHGKFWRNKKNQYGMAKRLTLVKRLKMKAKKQGREFFLFSGGDINTGSFESDLLEAEPDFKGMNLLGYDAMAVGNHEFDKPFKVLKKQEKLADFPFLSANIFYGQSKKRVFKPFRIFEKKGIKLGVYGLTTETTPLKKAGEETIEFKNPVEIASEDIPKLRKEVDVLIGLTHLGCYHDNPSLVDKTGDIHLVKNVKGFDMIIGGHSQVALYKPVYVNDVPIVQAKEYGEFVGKIEFEVFNHQIKNFKYELLPVTNIKEDEQMLKLLTPYIKKASELGERVIAFSHDFFTGKDREVVRRKEAALGNLIGMAYREKTKADIALVGGGAIRTDLEKGNISFKNIKEILPFGNTLTTAILTGKELKDYLQPIVKLASGEKNGAFPQLSGIKIKVDPEFIIQDIEIAGQAMKENKTYKIVMDSYFSKKEKQYPRLNLFKTFIDTGYVDYLSFIEYLKNKKEIFKKDYLPTGDISVVKSF